mmetsp:Transcript_31881/g.51770  ORF Transcript_31881/g.51770 Transcript_31881/m.51770 type:complete len:133 (-) Transcript_31881:192-590(-)
MHITALYGGALTLWYLVLTARVILYRRENLIGLGDGNNNTMQRRIRAHGNFAEYVPLTLLLLYLLETSGARFFSSPFFIHLIGALLLIGRLLHGYSLSFTELNMFGRQGGMALTLLAMGISGLSVFFVGFYK